MLCEICGKNKAVVDLTKMTDEKMSVVHLCKSCAAAEGVQTESADPSSPLVDFLAQMGGEIKPQVAGESRPEPCPFCGLTFKDFRKRGRLGCPHCYAAFESHIEGLLRRVHGGTQHLGKVYLPPDPTANEIDRRLEGLKRRLDRAVESEDFEKAATLRDQIRGLEMSQ